MAESTLSGISACEGLAIGPIYRLAAGEVGDRVPGTPDEERQALERAIAQAAEELERTIAGEDQLAGEILEFQAALLEDDDLLAPAYQAIADGMAADRAWSTVMDSEIADYRSGGDEMTSGRADDLVDLRRRVLKTLTRDPAAGSGPTIPPGAILVADDLTPSAFLEQDWSRLAGAAIRGGSPTSHVSILARARGVPLLVGLRGPLCLGVEEPMAILDAVNGHLVLEPANDSLQAARALAAQRAEEAAAAGALLDRPAATAAHERVHVLVNVDDPGSLADLRAACCDGIGLARSEFLFDGGRLPDEDTQLAVYQRLIAWAEGRPVTIRTLDAGGDKPIPGVTPAGESNPFLGLRGLRLSLRCPEVLLVQLRAVLRAAATGRLRIMAPMVTEPGEIAELKALVGRAAAELGDRGLTYALPPIGMMVEVPAAALTAEAFDVDFYSIGSNDLIQYVTATARDNAAVAPLGRADNPAVLELIRRTVDAGRRRGADVSLCGDMASTPALVPHLLTAGLRSLSVAPAQLGPVKLAVSRWPGQR